MAKRPPTDYIKSLLDDKSKAIRAAERDINNGINIPEAEQRLVENARVFAQSVNKLTGRIALTEADIETIIEQSKKAAGL